jgi:acetoin utilization protein AcuB
MKTSQIVKPQLVLDVPNLIVTDPGSSAEEALKIMSTFKIHHLMVLEGEKFAGIVSDRDILLHAIHLGNIKRISEFTVGQAMRKDLPAIEESTEVREAFAMMQETQSDALPILRGAKIMGILTETDMMRGLEHLLRKEHNGRSLVAREESLLVNPLSQRLIQLLADIGV